MRLFQSPEEIAQGIKAGNRLALARGITLVESTLASHRQQADRLFELLMPIEHPSIRIGISGSPGVGKSTFIEAVGPELISRYGNLGILAVDPTSPLRGGSILGDKTRMTMLSRNEKCFIRPSPAGKSLGGVARKTRESILLLEAFGYNCILVETVGVGQSEHVVNSMVDCFVMLQLPRAGDELQGIKKGILELCDVLVINKADGDAIRAAQQSLVDHKRALHLVGKDIPILSCSSLEKIGIKEVLDAIEHHHQSLKTEGQLTDLRSNQLVQWFEDLLQEEFNLLIQENPKLAETKQQLLQKVRSQSIPIGLAAHQWMQEFFANAQVRKQS